MRPEKEAEAQLEELIPSLLGEPPESDEVPTEKTEPVAEGEEPRKGRKKKKVWLLSLFIVTLVGAIVAAAVLLPKLFQKRLKVETIEITQWRMTDNINFDDYSIGHYDGTVVSNEKTPFVGVIGSYTNDSETPKFVCMEGGKGTIQTVEFEDKDPSTEYRPIGYIAGVKMTNSEMSDIKYTDYDYYDYKYLKETSCKVDIEFQMVKPASGMLFYELYNDESGEKTYEWAVAAQGKATTSEYVSELPLKYRGVTLRADVKLFCPAKEVKDGDYKVEKEFEIEKDAGENYTYFSGEQELTFPEFEDGIILYTATLNSGGEKSKRGKNKVRTAYLHNGSCTLTTYDSVDNDEKPVMPNYDLEVIGYITWEKLKSGERI